MHYEYSGVYGQWDKILYAYSIKSPNNPVGNDDLLHIINFKYFPDQFVFGLTRRFPKNFSLPGYLDGLLYQDDQLKGRNQLLLDSTHARIYAFSETQMDIFTYSKTSYGDFQSARVEPRKTAKPPAPWISSDFRLRFQFPSSTEMRLHSLDGRLLTEWKVAAESRELPLRAALPGGLHFLRWKSGSLVGQSTLFLRR